MKEKLKNLLNIAISPLFLCTLVYVPEDMDLRELETMETGRGYQNAKIYSLENGDDVVFVPTGGSAKFRVNGRRVEVKDIRQREGRSASTKIDVYGGDRQLIRDENEPTKLRFFPGLTAIFSPDNGDTETMIEVLSKANREAKQ